MSPFHHLGETGAAPAFTPVDIIAHSRCDGLLLHQSDARPHENPSQVFLVARAALLEDRVLDLHPLLW